MSIGNNDLIIHIENCEMCQNLQDIIDNLIIWNKKQIKENQISTNVLFDLQNECFINSGNWN